MLIYGTALFNGDTVPQDRVLGYALVSRAAAQGLAPAKETLSDMDQIMPLEQRKKGVAIAKAKAKTAPAGSANRKTQVAAKTATKPAEKAKAPASKDVATSGWVIQLGAFSRRSSAEALFRKLSSTAALSGKSAIYVPAAGVTRLQIAGFGDKAAAASACAALARTGQACFVTRVR
jgi:cell division protein FtsN